MKVKDLEEVIVLIRRREELLDAREVFVTGRIYCRASHNKLSHLDELVDDLEPVRGAALMLLDKQLEAVHKRIAELGVVI